MTIEKTHASHETKSSSAPDIKAGKGKAAPSDNASGDGFFALLSALDAASDVVVAPATVEESAVVVQGDACAALTPMPLDVPALELVDDTVLDAFALLAQSAQWGGGLESAVVSVTDVDAAAGMVKPSAAVRFSAPQLALQVEQGVGSTGSATLALHKRATHQFEQAFHQSQVTATPQVDNVGAYGSSDVQAFQAVSRRDAVFAMSAPLETTQMVTAAAIRREERGQDHAIFKMNAVEPTVAPTTTPLGSSAVSVLGASAPVSTPEAYLAEQVKFWISNDVHNAEMKLDGLGDGPVEVSISMQGNEAQVAFRTDEVRVREVLENASAHLKEMLQREGVLLSGVSVGTSDAGGAGTQERKTPGSARQISVTPGGAKGENPSSVASRGTGRTLDLFV